MAAREKPLFETLKDLPTAQLKVSAPRAERSGDDANVWLQLVNGDNYARLLRVRLDSQDGSQAAPYMVLYDDNYFDLLPHETRTMNARLLFPTGNTATFSGKLVVSGTNVEPVTMSVRWSQVPTEKGNRSSKAKIFKSFVQRNK